MLLIVSVVHSEPPRMKIYFGLLLFHLFCFLPFSVNAGKWMLIGGYDGVEGQAGSTAIGDVEMLTLEQEDKFGVKTQWCQKSLSDAPTALDLATVDWVDAFEFVSKHLGNKSFTSGHHTITFVRALVCGGANKDYDIQKKCW